MSSAVDDQLFDPGLQPERTALAWRRTGLSMIAATLIALRTVPQLLGAWTLVPLLGLVVAAVAATWMAHRRYRDHHARLTVGEGDRVPFSGGRLAALTAVVTLGLGAACLSFAVTRF